MSRLADKLICALNAENINFKEMLEETPYDHKIVTLSDWQWIEINDWGGCYILNTVVQIDPDNQDCFEARYFDAKALVSRIKVDIHRSNCGEAN